MKNTAITLLNEVLYYCQDEEQKNSTELLELVERMNKTELINVCKWSTKVLQDYFNNL
jgi:hypothetical protein